MCSTQPAVEPCGRFQLEAERALVDRILAKVERYIQARTGLPEGHERFDTADSLSVAREAVSKARERHPEYDEARLATVAVNAAKKAYCRARDKKSRPFNEGAVHFADTDCTEAPVAETVHFDGQVEPKRNPFKPASGDNPEVTLVARGADLEWNAKTLLALDELGDTVGRRILSCAGGYAGWCDEATLSDDGCWYQPCGGYSVPLGDISAILSEGGHARGMSHSAVKKSCQRTRKKHEAIMADRGLWNLYGFHDDDVAD